MYGLGVGVGVSNYYIRICVPVINKNPSGYKNCTSRFFGFLDKPTGGYPNLLVKILRFFWKNPARYIEYAIRFFEVF
jgi:hypothetical protein